MIRRTLSTSTTDRVFLAAAGCAFYATLALFPAISMLIPIYGLILDPLTAEQQLVVLSGLLPAPAYSPIEDRIHFRRNVRLIGGVVGIMPWFYMSAHAVLLGAKLNARPEETEAARQTGQEWDWLLTPVPVIIRWGQTMAGWDEGYVSDVVYTSKFLRETTPVWLAAAALLLGHRPPDLARPFCFADLGCGHGLTAIIVAAACPHAEVWGFDFNPAHVESARELASRSGLTNLHFQETSFATLAALPEAALPAFDFIVSHGVMSWVSQQNQAHLVDVIGQRLRPGGLAYLSYNVATGWGAMPPMRALMRLLMLSSSDRTDRSASGVLDYLDSMKHAGARFFGANPSLEQRLEEIRKQDPRYIAHEFLNRDWHPLMFADVAERMGSAKCSYIGSATLVENIDRMSVPEGMVSLIAATPDPVLRETVRDFASAQMFRRDIYRRGVLPMPDAEHIRLLDPLSLVWLDRAQTDLGNGLAPTETLSGLPQVHDAIVERLTAGDRTLGEIRRNAAFAESSLADLLQAVMLLMSDGYVHPALPRGVQTAARGCTDRLNAAIGAMNATGSEINHLASPVIGSALQVDLLETLIVRELGFCRSRETDIILQHSLTALGESERLIQRDGTPVLDARQARALPDASVKAIAAGRLPLLRRLAITPVQELAED